MHSGVSGFLLYYSSVKGAGLVQPAGPYNFLVVGEKGQIKDGLEVDGAGGGVEGFGLGVI